MDTGLFHVFHDPADDEVTGGVTNGIDVDLDGIVEKTVDEHGTLGGEPALLAERAIGRHVGHGFAQGRSIVDDLHGPSTEHVGRTHEHRVADPISHRESAVDIDRGSTGRLLDTEAVTQLVPALTVFRSVDRCWRCARHQVGGEHAGELERGLTAETHNEVIGLFALDHIHDVFVGERFEVEPVARVVVRRNRLRVAVDHDGLETGVAECIGGVDAAIVELDALADAVGPRPEDGDLRTIRRADLVVVLVGGVVIRRLRVELGGAGVNGLERCCDAGREPRRADLRLRDLPEISELGVGEAELFGPLPLPFAQCAG